MKEQSRESTFLNYRDYVVESLAEKRGDVDSFKFYLLFQTRSSSPQRFP